MNSNDSKPYIHWSNNVTDYILVGVSSTLSVIGALIIILTYVFIKDIRTVSRHIIVCISVADLVTCLSNLSGLFITPSKDLLRTPPACIVQSFFGTSAILSAFLWTMMLAVYLYIVIVKERPSTGKKVIIPFAHLLCWPLPLAINFFALGYGMLGNGGDITSSGWCWITARNLKNKESYAHWTVVFWMILDGKGIEIITYVIIACLYIAIKIHLSAKVSDMFLNDVIYIQIVGFVYKLY